MGTKHEVLQAHLKQWLACKGDRKERGALTKQLSHTLSMHPKSIGRAMKRLQMRGTCPPRKRGRSTYYGKDVDAAVECIWEEMDHPCAENMHPIIKEYVHYFQKEGQWRFGDETTGKLCAMSLGTLKLKIRMMRKKRGIGKGRSATISSPLKGMIPIRKSHTWAGLPPGYIQLDSVVHCGDILTGDVVYSVGMVDFATYWSEYTTQWNKGEVATLDSIQVVVQRFPFPIREMHPDTGNEFINYHVYRWAQSECIAMTRSEPYQKNDNMCIEERNGSLARKHLGYVRMDKKELVALTSEIMRIACLLHNHFRPVRRTLLKRRVNGHWKRQFEHAAKTPYERVMEHKKVSLKDKERLRAEHENLNPLQLKRELVTLKAQLKRIISD